VRSTARSVERPEADAGASGEHTVLYQHDVRDLVARGLAVEELALAVESRCGVAHVTPLVNVLETTVSEETHLRIERFLDVRRRIGPCELRIHPVADLVCTTEELKAMQAETCRELGIDPDLFEPVEPSQPFAIDSLVDVIWQTMPEGIVTISAQSRNLVVLGSLKAQARIAEFLDDLRKDE
jgi:hypothetical protein